MSAEPAGLWFEHGAYGYLRGELGAGLVNGVFLLAVCFIILLEALERFANIDEVKQALPGREYVVSNIGGLGLAHIFNMRHDQDVVLALAAGNCEGASNPEWLVMLTAGPTPQLQALSIKVARLKQGAGGLDLPNQGTTCRAAYIAQLQVTLKPSLEHVQSRIDF